jgi:hypothetical protein
VILLRGVSKKFEGKRKVTVLVTESCPRAIPIRDGNISEDIRR